MQRNYSDLYKYLKAIREETQPIEGHDDPNAIQDVWNCIYEYLDELEVSKYRTDEEIDNLKMQWQMDPCWDIEDTEGFEAYKKQLEAWRIQEESTWSSSKQDVAESCCGWQPANRSEDKSGEVTPEDKKLVMELKKQNQMLLNIVETLAELLREYH